ncbi:nuclear transport factor 2 family protein [Sedimentibacter saalensis]|uniref:SnoaL-like protein n=1 Tax=Sedimentibacter saalensis TaxID=130788 RepID=A0A562JB28_9FIRM|nr:nuclear transport factor 2 family protein [Sedimentibacter saalensis]TWH80381.1 SnoaL-like protein [Sedimentibacter saalensis]
MKNENTLQKTVDEKSEIIKILRKFQNGYTGKDIEKVDAFVEELFKDDACVLGTGTGELFLGLEQVKSLIIGDWKYWGDIKIDLENVYINNENTVAWVATTGNVKYTFENTQEKYESYLNFIKNKIEESEIKPKQKITFINWVLALAYHQRLEKKREYLWPLRLSGVLLKDDGKWKFANIHFSIPKANFPDERFENSKECIESYNNQNEMVEKYINNQMTIEIKTLLKSFEKEIVGQKNISKELISKYFVMENNPYIIRTENQWCIGVDQIKEFFAVNNDYILTLDLEHAIVSKHNKVTWVTACGKLKQTVTEEELYEKILGELGNLLQSDITSEEKLFVIHRSIAYALKESATGVDYTYPIRLTAVILEHMESPIFQQIHFSFPFQWIFEGKIDSFKLNKSET